MENLGLMKAFAATLLVGGSWCELLLAEGSEMTVPGKEVAARLEVKSIPKQSMPSPAKGRPLPWQDRQTIAEQVRKLPHLIDDQWYSCGGKEGTLHTSEENGPWGGKYFRFTVKVDHHNKVDYPQGWPSFERKTKKPIDMSGWDVIQYWIRVKSTAKRTFPIRFIMREGVLQEAIQPSPTKRWTKVHHKIRNRRGINAVASLHFFICENQYSHDDEMTFEIGGFELGNKLNKELVSLLPAGEAAMGLWVGKRADRNDEIVILEERTPEVPVLLVTETTRACRFERSDELHFRFHEVFSGKQWAVKAELGRDIPQETVTRIEGTLPLPELAPGYYLVRADLRRRGRSLLRGRVGSDDLYIRGREESMTRTVLSLRTGMVLPLQDLMGSGIIMGRARVALPHMYDPLGKETYGEFLRLFGAQTGMQAEGIEAGLTGLFLAAEAFRKSGDRVRARFTEKIAEGCIGNMLTKWQAPNGAVVTYVSMGAATAPPNYGHWNPDQMGEWVRPLTYGMLYYSRIHKKPRLVSRLNRACRKAVDYIVTHSTQASNGIPGVIRHVMVMEKADGTIEKKLYHQEGRQCDVYLPRIVAGLSYYAYAMQLTGERVPERYWRAMDNTVKWCQWKMKDNGWFDWQCGDTVEGGCHTFLGNIYLGEGMFGCYLANRQAGRTEQAEEAKKAARKAYRYVTDHCYIRGRKFEYPLEFWVGPYVYWLFTEYLDAIGPDERFEDTIRTLDRKWRLERQWRDFLWRGHGNTVGRSKGNGILVVSILGYLGLRQMEEIGKPFHLPLPE